MFLASLVESFSGIGLIYPFKELEIRCGSGVLSPLFF